MLMQNVKHSKFSKWNDFLDFIEGKDLIVIGLTEDYNNINLIYTINDRKVRK